MRATAAGKLAETPVVFRDGAACCVIAASGGYPGPYEKGILIEGLTQGQLPDADLPEAYVFHAGTKRTDGRTGHRRRTRVFGVTATANTLGRRGRLCLPSFGSGSVQRNAFPP